MKSTWSSEFAAEFDMVHILFSGYFLLGTAFTDHRVLGADLIMRLDILKVERLLAVLAVERPLRALSLIMALLFIEADSFFAGRAGDDHELAFPLVVHLVLLYASFPSAAFIDTNSWQIFNFPSNRIVWKSASLF